MRTLLQRLTALPGVKIDEFLARRRSASLNALPIEATDADRLIIQKASEYSMTSFSALWAALQATKYIAARGVPGAIAECGVWRGGSSMVMLSTLLTLGEFRDIWLYDTYSGMTPPGEADRVSASGMQASKILETTPKANGYNVWAIASLEDVKHNMSLTGYPQEKIHFIVGDVLETLNENRPQPIAILRLDTDWYHSTRAELDALYDNVSIGGVVIIDDYGFWEGARRAVDEFLAERKEHVLMVAVDQTVRMWIKQG